MISLIPRIAAASLTATLQFMKPTLIRHATETISSVSIPNLHPGNWRCNGDVDCADGSTSFSQSVVLPTVKISPGFFPSIFNVYSLENVHMRANFFY